MDPSPEERELLEDCLKSGKSLEATINFLTDSRKEPSAAVNISEILNDTNLSIEDKFCLLKGNMKQSELNKIQNLVERGFSVEEALKTVASEDENETDFKKKIKCLIKGRNLTPNEMLELIKEYLSEEELKTCHDMIRQETLKN